MPWPRITFGSFVKSSCPYELKLQSAPKFSAKLANLIWIFLGKPQSFNQILPSGSEHVDMHW